ncbi:MAG: magnesium transporter [Candidatus Dependentiae bacterium]|nr:magnesium transporter [Candidatus Dependentiae bacterium]
MMVNPKTLEDIALHIQEVLEQQTIRSKNLIKQLNLAHYADIAQLINSLDLIFAAQLFTFLDPLLQVHVFYELHPSVMRLILSNLSSADKANLLKNSHADEITDLFDILSDEELQGCLEVLHQKERQQVLSLMQFAPDTAGGIMNVDVITFMQNFTVAKSITLLQRLRPRRDLHRSIYVTDESNKLVGVIKLEDLVLKSPETPLSSILRQIPFIATVDQDQQEIANKMAHYRTMIAPVVNDQDFLLGVIAGETLVDVLQREAQEEVQKMSGFLLNQSYLESKTTSIVFRRGSFLAFLLLAESLTSVIMESFHATLSTFLFSFIAMLVATGGNTSSQTSAIVIQGLSSGDINDANMRKFLKREFLIGFILAIFLSMIAFVRIYTFHREFWGSLVVSLSLGMIVFTAVVFGSVLPIILKKFHIDPAFFAGPFLATIMDIFGILVYCYIAYLILH